MTKSDNESDAGGAGDQIYVHTPSVSNPKGSSGINVVNFFENMKGPHPLENRITQLKRDGFNFTNEAMVNLVNAVNKQRIVNIDLNPVIVSAKHALEGVIKYLKEK